MNDTFSSCFAMTNIVYKGQILGPVVRMGYLLSDYWQNDVTLQVMSIIVGIMIGLMFVFDAFLFGVIKVVNNRRSMVDLSLLIFNFTNALIFLVLTQIGWTIPTFFIAALHNSTELLIILILFKKYFPSLFPSKRVYNLFLYFLTLIAIAFTLPHLIIQDFSVNFYLKLTGAITDVILWIFCLIMTVKYIYNVIMEKACKSDTKIPPHRHLVFLLNVLSHTSTVMLSVFSCQSMITQAVFILIGTILMNSLGLIYYITCFVEKYNKEEKGEK